MEKKVDFKPRPGAHTSVKRRHKLEGRKEKKNAAAATKKWGFLLQAIDVTFLSVVVAFIFGCPPRSATTTITSSEAGNKIHNYTHTRPSRRFDDYASEPQNRNKEEANQ